MFEATVAVSEPKPVFTFILTFVIVVEKCDSLPGIYIKADYGMYHILGFRSIGSDILNGSSAHLSRYPGEILEAGESVVDTPINQVSPFFTRTGHNEHFCLGFRIGSDTFYTRMEHETIEIFQENKVAASTDVKHNIFCKFPGEGNLFQFLNTGIFGEYACLGRKSEGGER